MYAPERHAAIVDTARLKGRVEVRALADTFDVTPETIRRDLTLLERRGLLQRAHGGAIPVERLAGVEPPVSEREGYLASEKDRIARAALAELPDSGSIIIDAGTSTARFANMLPRDRELTVVTNSIPIAAKLAMYENIELHLIGGHVRHKTLAVVGSWTDESLRRVSVDVAFMGTNAITPERGLTTPDIEEARIKTALITASRRSVVLADHSKFGREDFAQVVPLNRVDTIITDSGIDHEHVLEIELAGPDVVVA